MGLITPHSEMGKRRRNGIPPKTFKSVIRQSPLPDVIPIFHKWHAIFGAGALNIESCKFHVIKASRLVRISDDYLESFLLPQLLRE